MKNAKCNHNKKDNSQKLKLRARAARERVIQKYQSNAIQQHTKQTDAQSARKREKRTKK
jgi:hypothetical protein